MEFRACRTGPAMTVHRRIVLVVSTLLFTLLAMAAWIETDSHDRAFPENLGVAGLVNIEFGPSQLGDERAFALLREYSNQLGLGLVRVAPDLTGAQEGQVYVRVGEDTGRLPATVDRFSGSADSTVRDRDALANSYASGQYLVTGSDRSVPDLLDRLARDRVTSEWVADDLATTLQFVVLQDSLALSLLATTSLLVALVLYWLSVKARGRALRVLGGAPLWRIQVEDLGGFGLPLAGSAALVTAVGAVVVATVHGPVFVGHFVSTLVVLVVLTLAATMLVAGVMSLVSAPDAATLAARRPAIGTLGGVSVATKAALFVVVLAAVAPTVHAVADSRLAADQLVTWRALSDHVALSFTGADDEVGFAATMPAVGAVVAQAERRDAVALSYTWTADLLTDADLDTSGPVALVNPRWIDLMLPDAATTPGELTDGFAAYLAESLPLWTRDESVTALPDEVAIVHVEDPAGVPLASAGGRDLLFPPSATLIVVPSPYRLFDDDFLASISSTRNLVFSGLGPTEDLLDAQGLSGVVGLRLIAEEGVLRAQAAEATAWLKALSVVALIVALALCAVISAFISSVLSVRRDFPLRLAGRGWWEILAPRLLRDTGLGLALIGLVAVAAGRTDAALVVAVGCGALLGAPLTHISTARWVFTRARTRTL